MRALVKTNRGFFLLLTLAGIALRLIFVLRFPLIQGDSIVYGDLARNLLNTHIYGLGAPDVTPTLVRLPGYPFFLALCFALFGNDNYHAVMLLQLILDLGTCLIVADIARRLTTDRTAKIAFALACLCPFTANYVGTGLSETLEIFFTALAFLIAAAALEKRFLLYWAATGLATAGAILVRPDGGLILISLGIILLWRLYKDAGNRRYTFLAGILVTAISLSPLVPWTIRNWRVFHVFQPLVTEVASDPNEFIPNGWNRYIDTWDLDYSSTEDITFKVDGEALDIYSFPKRAFDSQEQFLEVANLIRQYNVAHSMTPEIDKEFARIAADRRRKHPLMIRVALPIGRLVGVWLRPRTEMFPVDTHWWEFDEDPHDSSISMALGAINLILVAAAFVGALRYRQIRFFGLLLVYPIARSLLLVKMAAIEDRYTIECFPMVLVLAAHYFNTRRAASSKT